MAVVKIESSYLEKKMSDIISTARDMQDGFAKLEQGCKRIIRLAEEVRGRWQCRFCKKWFPNSVAKESDYFGDKCLSCSARAELVAKCNK